MASRRIGRWNRFLDPQMREDADMIQGQIKHLQRNLDKGSPRSLTRRERTALEKQVSEDRAFFKKNMVPKRSYYLKSSDPGFENATKAVFEREVANTEFQRRANRYKNNIRELDPDNPEASNIEQFRSKK